jgi:hypothetical protein
MKATVSIVLIAAGFALAGCSGGTPAQNALPLTSAASVEAGAKSASSGGLTELFDLNYANGSITVYAIHDGKANKTASFKPGGGIAQGLASDAHGNVYTTITESASSPCKACAQVYTDGGKLLRSLDAPTLQGAPGAPQLTDVSVDAHDNVYVSDYGQQAVYFFPRGKVTKNGPTIVVQDSNNAASVLSTPNGKNVLISGGCGFASVAPFTRVSAGKYTQGSCFGIGTLALIGGTVDDLEDVLTPVDGVPGLVSISSPSGGATFQVPDRLGSISGVALNRDASVAYVANAHEEVVYAFARPANGWLAGTQPKLLATYKGFKALDVIAVPQ